MIIFQESGEVEGKFSSSCTWVTARSPTPFHFPFPPFGGGLGGCFGPGFADVEGMNRQNCSLLSLLHQQSLLASPLSDDGGSRSSTGSGAFRCGVCLAAFPSVWLLERHSALQHSVRSPEDTDLDEKPFKCEQCGQSYRYRSAYLKHREQNHRARLPADKLFTCDVCGMQFRYLKSFKKHRLNHALEKLHSKSPPQVEGFPRSLKSNGSLERILHEKISVNLPESSTDFRTKIFSSIKGGSALVNGDAFPSPPMPLSGDDGRTSAPPAAVTSPPESGGSDQVSSSNEALGASTQVSKTDEKNFYKYSLDDYYFNSGGAVSTPGSPSPKKVLKLENVSDGEQDETVDSPSFGPSASLINFLRMDSVDRQRDRRFACPFCGKCVRSKENLKLHVRKHTGERPFVCLFCGRAFGGKSDLTRHLRIHTGERPYHCEMCGKCFARADYLSKHLTTHIHNAQR